VIQHILGEPIWAGRVGAAEQCGRTPPTWGHVNAYDTFCLDMSARLPPEPPGPDADSPQYPLLNV